MKKKKLILALLASVCVATGAAGIAACGADVSGPTRDPAIYAAYEDYTKTTDNPLSYEEWLADIIAKYEAGGEKGPVGNDGEDGVTIEDVNIITINGTQYYEFIFTNGKIVRLSEDGDKITNTCFTMNVVDINGNPVENVLLSVGYRDERFNDYCMTANGSFVDKMTSSSYYTTTTNSKGIATFYVFPESEHDFNAYVINTPRGYRINWGKDSLGLFDLTYKPFEKDEDGNYSITLTLEVDNSWDFLYDAKNDLKFKRYIPNHTKPDEIIEDYEPYTKSVTNGRYNYFTFEPAKAVYPDGADEDLRYEIDVLARHAATGVYRISWKASNPAANVQLMYYDFYSGDYFFRNDDGSPRNELVAMFAGDQHYIDVEITYDVSHLVHCLAFISDTNCNVTISVERIGEVAAWTDVTVIAELPAGTTKADDQNGRVLDVSLNAKVAKGDDGYYHLDSKNGPIIYVQLLSGTRANEMSIDANTRQEVSDGSIGGGTTTRSVFDNYITEEFDQATNSGVRTHTNYTQVVKSYVSYANSDGLYPVNEQIKTILETYCQSFMNWSRYPNYWVAACSYYGAPSDGTANSPYDVAVGRNNTELNGTTYFSFKTTTTAYYGFATTNGEINVKGGVTIDDVYANSTTLKKVVYVQVSAHEEFTFTVTGNGAATVHVVTIADNKMIDFHYDSDSNQDVGTERNPVKITGGAVYLVNINHTNSNGQPIAVDMTAMIDLDGEFRVTVYGSDTAKVYNAEFEVINGQVIVVIEGEAPTRFYVDDTTNGTFFIKIERITQD